jgi:hypothetical protein
MNLTRALIQIALLVGLAGCVQGDEFWGRQLPGQPTQFILGYGSLINSSSRNATASQPIAAIPVRLSASFGYVRGWTIRSPSGFTALGLRRRAADETGQSINGVLYPVEGNARRASVQPWSTSRRKVGTAHAGRGEPAVRACHQCPRTELKVAERPPSPTASS